MNATDYSLTDTCTIKGKAEQNSLSVSEVKLLAVLCCMIPQYIKSKFNVHSTFSTNICYNQHRLTLKIVIEFKRVPEISLIFQILYKVFMELVKIFDRFSGEAVVILESLP